MIIDILILGLGISIFNKLFTEGKSYLTSEYGRALSKVSLFPLLTYSFVYTNTSSQAERDLSEFLERNLLYSQANDLDIIFIKTAKFYMGYEYETRPSIYDDLRETFKIRCRNFVEYIIIYDEISNIIQCNQLTQKERDAKEEWNDTILRQGYYQG